MLGGRAPPARKRGLLRVQAPPAGSFVIKADPLLSGIGMGISGLSLKKSSTARRAPGQELKS